MYQQVDLASGKTVGIPGPVPRCLAGLSDISLATPDFTPPTCDLAGQAWWPVTVTTPAYDPRKQTTDGTLSVGAPDMSTRTVPATVNLRPLTQAEVSALPPRQATFAQISAALDDLGLTSVAQAAWPKLKPLAQAYLSSHYSDPVPEDNAKMAKLVGLIAASQSTNPTLTTSALYDKAVTE